jgi:transposase
MNNLRVIAIDLAKSTFQVCLFDRHMQVLSNRSMSRKALVKFLSKQSPALVAMEACGRAHYWARKAQGFGHRAVVLPPKQVTPYHQGQKHDGNDALAIGIASQQPQLKTVGVKTLEQQGLQGEKRIQEHLSDQRTATGNLLRGLLAEFGLEIPKGTAALKRALPEYLADAENALPMPLRASLALAWELWQHQEALLGNSEQALSKRANSLAPCRELLALEGVGDKNAIGLYLCIGDAQHFKNGREAAACIGMTPQQYSTGGRTQLMGIGKYRGDQRLRSSLIVGSRAAVNALAKREPRNTKELWLKQLIERRGPGRAAVALANKNIRTAWSMLHHHTPYTAQALVQ